VRSPLRETDTTAIRNYNAIVGGVVSHFDEVTGDLIVRGVVGWVGRRSRRHGQKRRRHSCRAFSTT